MNQFQLPYLFRTYKNLRSTQDPQRKSNYRNPGPAHDIPIWQVARATSAAPRYFKEVKIEDRKYVDGGFGTNNPSHEIYLEVLRMNNLNEECVKGLVSVGTGKSKRSRLTSDKGLRKFWHYGNFAIKAVTESEEVHIRMVGLLEGTQDQRDKFEYNRLNVETGLDGMKLDEWRARGRLRIGLGKRLRHMRAWQDQSRGQPAVNHIALKGINGESATQPGQGPSNGAVNHPVVSTPNGNTASGSGTQAREAPKPRGWFDPRNKTLENIAEHTRVYLEDENVMKSIRASAESMVNSRRARVRSDPARWQRACFGFWFQCSVRGCPRGEAEYIDRHAMEKHLKDKHPELFRDLHVPVGSSAIVVEEEEMNRLLDKYKIIVR